MIKQFFKKSQALAPGTNKQSYKSLKWQVFLSATIGYGLYYVCRLSLNVVKKPIVDSGFMDETQLGIIGSALFFAYAIGKLVNGFLADYSNIKRFMAIGLLISALANLLMGFTDAFVIFVICWGFNGWCQSMGAPSSIVSLSRWYKDEERGSFYGLWSTSHNIGEALTYICTAIIVSYMGWRWGFYAAGAIGIIGVIIISLFFHDSPESKGLAPVREPSCNSNSKTSTWEQQKSVLKMPAIWMIALASAFMYISRYAVTSWGPYYFEAAKGYTLAQANSLVAVSSVCGIVGTALSGVVSDRFFGGKRTVPALLFGLLNVAGLSLFLLCGNGVWWLDVTSMVMFGLAIGALICYLGGLMAVDLAPKDAAGAALGVVGVTSYLAAGIQDIASGHLIESNKTLVEGETVYNFTPITIFWISASVLSVICAALARKKC